MDIKKGKIEAYFKKLEFNKEAHTYKVGEVAMSSVSKLIGSFHYPFERQKISSNTAFRRNVDQSVVLAEWDATRDEACARGHRVHDFGEAYVWDRSLKPSCPQEEAVVKFWAEMPDHIVPVIMELKMYHKTFIYAGTADIILYNKKTNKYIIADYKTNKDLFKNFKNKKLKYPFAYLKDSPYNKYQLQLTFYQLLFEQTGFQVEDRKLIWLLKDGNYNMYSTENFASELKYYLTNRN
ncbi:MAG: PD-(D/E)XK nuclease family protein [Gammaproteobacteria bacterium]|nr:PD-(D/E)XK nuclease family protein [Gammaproteobacteria bacterium]